MPETPTVIDANIMGTLIAEISVASAACRQGERVLSWEQSKSLASPALDALLTAAGAIDEVPDGHAKQERLRALVLATHSVIEKESDATVHDKLMFLTALTVKALQRLMEKDSEPNELL